MRRGYQGEAEKTVPARAAAALLCNAVPLRPEGVFTIPDYMRENKVSRNAAKTQIGRLVAAGKIELVLFKGARVDGQVTPMRGWRIVEEAGAK